MNRATNPREDPQRRKQRAKFVEGEGKKSDILCGPGKGWSRRGLVLQLLFSDVSLCCWLFSFFSFYFGRQMCCDFWCELCVFSLFVLAFSGCALKAATRCARSVALQVVVLERRRDPNQALSEHVVLSDVQFGAEDHEQARCTGQFVPGIRKKHDTHRR